MTKRNKKGAGPIPVSPKADAVFLECTYGDVIRANEEETAKEYARFAFVVTNALANRKLVWIPAFAMDRTQRVMLELVRCGAQTDEIYSLSRSGNRITKYYLDHPELFPERTTNMWGRLGSMYKKSKTRLKKNKNKQSPYYGREVLSFPSILLTTAGMMDAGSSYEYLDDLLPRTDVVLYLVGYQSPGTPGAQLKSGAKKIRLRGGREVPVRATVESFNCFSGHGDALENDKWLGPNIHSKIFLIHGDKESLANRKKGLEKRFGANVEIVERHKTIHLEKDLKNKRP